MIAPSAPTTSSAPHRFAASFAAKRRAFAWTAALMVTVGLGQSAHAAEPSVDSCISHNSEAQQLRKAKKLRAAREKLLVCSQPACPGAVQRDCSQWLREIDASLPTVSFAARGPNGTDVMDVQVSIDGEPLVSELDGSAIPVDPGKHVFVFEHDGAAVTREVLVVEGDKARKIEARFGEDSEANPSQERAQKKLSPFPFVLGGVGVAALVGGLVLNIERNGKIPPECRVVPGHCNDTQAGDPKLERAASLKDQANLGLGVAIGGGVLLAGGVTWFVIDVLSQPKTDRRAQRNAPHVRPELGFGYAGLRGEF